MKRWRIVGVVLIGVLLPVVSAAGEEKQERRPSEAPLSSTVKIIHPKNGETIPLSKEGAEVMVMYELTKGGTDKGDHVHVFLNDQERGIHKHPPKVFRFLQPGRYTVKLRIATTSHQLLSHEQGEDTVEFEVVAAP